MDESTISVTNRLMADLQKLEARFDRILWDFHKVQMKMETMQEDVDAIKSRVGLINELMGSIGEN